MIHLDIGKRIIVVPRNMQTIFSDLISSGTDYVIDNEHATGYMSPTFVLRDVTDRLITEQGRKFNIAAAMLGFLSGITKISNSAYKMVLPEPEDTNRLEDTAILSKTPADKNNIDLLSSCNTRECIASAIRSLNKTDNIVTDVYDLFMMFQSIGVQFTLIDNVLHISASMDVADLLREYPYEMFMLSMFQEWIANESAAIAGTLTITTPLAYILTQDRTMINRFSRSRWPFKMPDMPKFSMVTKNAMADIVSDFDWDIYAKYTNDPTKKTDSDFQYMMDMISVIQSLRFRKTNIVKSLEAYKNISDKTIKHVLRPWIFSNEDTEDVETFVGDA